MLLLGLNPEHLLTILQGQRLGPGWVTAIQDRKGGLLARALAHERFLGTIHPRHTVEQDVADRALFKAVSLEGEQVLRAVARSKVSGWYASSNISLAVAEAPLRRSLWLWGGGLVLAAGLTIALAWLFERGMSRPMRFASKAAGALSRGRQSAHLPFPSVRREYTLQMLTAFTAHSGKGAYKVSALRRAEFREDPGLLRLSLRRGPCRLLG